MQAVALARDLDYGQISQPVMMIYSENDQVIRPEMVQQRFAELGSRHKRLVPVNTSGDPSHHVIAGDIMSPSTTEHIVEQILDFLRSLPDD